MFVILQKRERMGGGGGGGKREREEGREREREREEEEEVLGSRTGVYVCGLARACLHVCVCVCVLVHILCERTRVSYLRALSDQLMYGCGVCEQWDSGSRRRRRAGETDEGDGGSEKSDRKRPRSDGGEAFRRIRACVGTGKRAHTRVRTCIAGTRTRARSRAHNTHRNA